MRTDYKAMQKRYERSIARVFRQATPENVAMGVQWYPTAQAALEGYRAVWPGENVPQAVCAILSPRTSWANNLEGVRRMARAVRDGNRVPPTVAGVRRNVAKAWDTANDGDTARVTGPKVSAFFANLCGNMERVTIDVWAARAAGVPESQMDHLDGHRYAALERAYQAVAKRVGFQPAQLQAIVWIVARGHGEGTMAGTKQARWTQGD